MKNTNEHLYAIASCIDTLNRVKTKNTKVIKACNEKLLELVNSITINK